MKRLLFSIAMLFSTGVIFGQCLSIECRTDTLVFEDGTCSAVVNFLSPLGKDTCAPISEFVFTNCGATGQTGPTQAQADAEYSATGLNGMVTVTAGIQYWRVPQTAVYTVEAIGGNGYGPNGGRGASMKGEFNLIGGQLLKIMVGQEAGAPIGSVNQYGGGGGTFVTDSADNPIIVAGGGGGSWAQTQTTLSDASITTSGNPGMNGPTNGTGGTAGMGGGTAASADGGGGLLTDGGGGAGGKAFVNGGLGGANRGQGGFGGGGGTSSWDNRRGGGGGGYSGGGAAGSTTTGFPEAGGGGSFNSGTNQTNTAGVGTGHGTVIFTLPSTPIITTQTGGLPSGSAFPVGTTKNTYTTTDGSQTATCSFSITVADPTTPTILFPFRNETICSTADPIPLPIGKPVGGTYSGKGVIANSFDPELAGIGTFWIVYTDNDHCPVPDSVPITVVNCTGIAAQNDEGSLSISPNPSNGIFSLVNNEGLNMDVTVYNTVGEVVYRGLNEDKTMKLDLGNQPDGIYILSVRTGENLRNYRLVKQ